MEKERIGGKPFNFYNDVRRGTKNCEVWKESGKKELKKWKKEEVLEHPLPLLFNLVPLT